MKQWICSIRPENFTEEVILEKKPVLLICMTRDESFSRQLQILQNVARKYEEELKVGLLDQDSLETFKRKLQFTGTPTFLLMTEGQEISRILGVSDEKTLTNLIDRHYAFTGDANRMKGRKNE
jgi:thioredoxin-like negative regulator of GroEL